jgi:hypothetical protein
MSKNVVLRTIGAVLLTLAVNLPRQLDRKHHYSHKTGVQIFAGIVFDVVFAVVVWLIFYGIEKLIERRRSAGPRSA